MRMTNLHGVHTASSRRVLGGFSKSSRRFLLILGGISAVLGRFAISSWRLFVPHACGVSLWIFRGLRPNGRQQNLEKKVKGSKGLSKGSQKAPRSAQKRPN